MLTRSAMVGLQMALEPEHELGDFTNPDIEEKPFMPLEEYLEKAKPNIMKTGLIRSEKEWQVCICFFSSKNLQVLFCCASKSSRNCYIMPK